MSSTRHIPVNADLELLVTPFKKGGGFLPGSWGIGAYNQYATTPATRLLKVAYGFESKKAAVEALMVMLRDNAHVKADSPAGVVMPSVRELLGREGFDGGGVIFRVTDALSVISTRKGGASPDAFLKNQDSNA